MSLLTRHRALSAAVATAVAGVLVAAVFVGVHRSGSITLASANPATPGNFTGYGFDQCQAPSQSAMDAWLTSSPYLAVGIYISGSSRGCRTQTNLDAAWVSTQLAKGWHLLPITVGPQASCNGHFPRYGSDPRINGAPASSYAAAAAQGSAEANTTVSAARSLGLVPGSTMYYDLEAFSTSNVNCRESALRFLSSWTLQLHKLGYLSGVYSSGASGIKALDQARATRPGVYTMPDHLWVADWDGNAGTSSSYVTAAAWQPDARIKQYSGGHDEKHGGVRINIDNDFVDVGRGTQAPAETHCGGRNVDLPIYRTVVTGAHAPRRPGATIALKCLLKEQGLFAPRVARGTGQRLTAAIAKYQTLHHWRATSAFGQRAWVTLLSGGTRAVVKYGSGSSDVRALQRALNAANRTTKLPVTGVFAAMTETALKTYQRKMGIAATGVANPVTWAALQAGRY